MIDLHQLEKVHGSPNTPQGRQPRHPITTASRSYQSTCQLWQIIRRSSQSAASRRQLMDPGFCRTDHCYMIWSLEEVKPISCNFCAQEFGDFKRVTHMSACRACLSQCRRFERVGVPSLFDSQDATDNTQVMDAIPSPGSIKRDGSLVAEEQQKRRQLRRTASRTKRH